MNAQWSDVSGVCVEEKGLGKASLVCSNSTFCSPPLSLYSPSGIKRRECQAQFGLAAAVACWAIMENLWTATNSNGLLALLQVGEESTQHGQGPCFVSGELLIHAIWGSPNPVHFIF